MLADGEEEPAFSACMLMVAVLCSCDGRTVTTQSIWRSQVFVLVRNACVLMLL